MLKTLESLSYNLITNGGNCFLGQADDKKLRRLIEAIKSELVQNQDRNSVGKTLPVSTGVHDKTSLCNEALDAFWQVIVSRFPQPTTGYMSPLSTIELNDTAMQAVHEWINNNVLSQDCDEKTV